MNQSLYYTFVVVSDIFRSINLNFSHTKALQKVCIFVDMILEIASNNFNSAMAAYLGGAHRIELVSNLSEGGVTPSIGTVAQCQEGLPIPTFPIIRARGGDFIYNQSEIKSMLYDIATFKNLNCTGIVIGALNFDASIDLKNCSAMVKEAGNMQITFHRAFDRAKNAEDSIQQIIDLGCHRILTSGQKSNALDGAYNIKGWNEKFGNQIIFMPGAGVTIENAKEILSITNAAEIHSSMKHEEKNKMKFVNENFINDNYIASSQELVNLLVQQLN